MSEIPGQSGYALPNFQTSFGLDFAVAIGNVGFAATSPLSIGFIKLASNPFGRELIRLYGHEAVRDASGHVYRKTPLEESAGNALLGYEKATVSKEFWRTPGSLQI